MSRRKPLRIWLQALRAPFFTASLIPVFTGAALVFFRRDRADWPFLPVVALCVVLFHGATNIINDYVDFKKGVDRPGTMGSSKVIEQNLLKPEQLLRAGWILFCLASLISIVFIPARGMIALLFIILAFFGGYLYTAGVGYKYLALGDIMVFMLMGPLMVIGTDFILTGRAHPDALLVSLPIGCLVAAILHANNLRDILDDKTARIRTMANIIGFRSAKIVYAALLSLAYIFVVLMIAVKTLPAVSLIVFFTAPLAGKNIGLMRQAEGPGSKILAGADVQTAMLHLLFGILYIAALIAGRFL
jgi:1,4-dihydroxy-2-naphthoate octaprenyltransferase